ncbi:MAG: hypothetical protein M0Z31_00410 [Clostridia bacterium]|nr:hypothetical protein [Clostridia bacterium]
MQEAIWQIGQVAYNPQDVISNYLQPLATKNKKGQPLQVVKIDFNLQLGTLELDVTEELDDNTSSKYCYIGHADAPSAPQWQASVKTHNYLLSQTITNLISMDIDEQLKADLKVLRDKFFQDIVFVDKGKEKHIYLLDLSSIGFTERNPKDIFNQQEGDIKKTIKVLSKEFILGLKEKYGITDKNIGLFVLAINGKTAANMATYQNLIIKEKKKVFAKGEKGCCSICGISEGLTADTSKLKMKFYTTTNLNFPSGFEKGSYRKNMLLCVNCMNNLTAGENFVWQNLSARLGNFTVFLIPSFLFQPQMDQKDLEGMVNKVQGTFNLTADMEKLKGFQGDIRMLLVELEQEDYFLMNMLFYRKGQQGQDVKVQRFIKDVHPTRFINIHKAIEKINQIGNMLLITLVDGNIGTENDGGDSRLSPTPFRRFSFVQ